MIARAIRHIVLMMAGSLAGAALARPWIWCLSYRSIDKLLALEKYRVTHTWSGEKKREF